MTRTKTRANANTPNNIVSVLDYGADPTGATDSRAVIQQAINDCYGTTKGRTLYFPAGKYLINPVVGEDGVKHGLYIPYTGFIASSQASGSSINLLGDSRRTALLCGGDDMYLIRWSASHSTISNFRLDNNGGTNNTALALVGVDPENKAGDQSNNIFENLVIRAFKGAGIILQCAGGTPEGSSACYYNTFRSIHINGGGEKTHAAIWFKSGPLGQTPTSNCNRNGFYDIVINSTYPAVHVESAQGTNFYNLRCESISGTCVKIDDKDKNGMSNNQTRFFGGDFEAFGTAFDNDNRYTEIYGTGYSNWGKSDFKKLPLINIGGTGVSESPEVTQAYVVDGNSYLASEGYGNGINVIKPIYDYVNGKALLWSNYAITTSNTEFADEIGESKSYFHVLGGIVTWTLRVAWTGAADNNGKLRIQLPTGANSNAHRLYGLINTSVTTNGTISNGSTVETAFARFSNTGQDLNGEQYVELTHSGDFNPSGNFNQAQIIFTYRYGA